MDHRRQKAEATAKEYMGVASLLKELGSGAEGFVFPSEQATAVKVFTHQERFTQELAACSRLAELEIIEILGFAIPRLVKHDTRRLVIEMTIVQPPFLLDFAQATIDEPFDFEAGQEQEWWPEVEEAFGPSLRSGPRCLLCVAGRVRDLLLRPET